MRASQMSAESEVSTSVTSASDDLSPLPRAKELWRTTMACLAGAVHFTIIGTFAILLSLGVDLAKSRLNLDPFIAIGLKFGARCIFVGDLIGLLRFIFQSIKKAW
jgi:hypothetical protein